MNISYLAVLIPVLWGALFFWALRQPDARRVTRPLTPEEVAERMREISRQLSVALNLPLVEATRQMTRAMEQFGLSLRKLTSVLGDGQRGG